MLKKKAVPSTNPEVTAAASCLGFVWLALPSLLHMLVCVEQPSKGTDRFEHPPLVHGLETPPATFPSILVRLPDNPCFSRHARP